MPSPEEKNNINTGNQKRASAVDKMAIRASFDTGEEKKDGDKKEKAPTTTAPEKTNVEQKTTAAPPPEKKEEDKKKEGDTKELENNPLYSYLDTLEEFNNFTDRVMTGTKSGLLQDMRKHAYETTGSDPRNDYGKFIEFYENNRKLASEEKGKDKKKDIDEYIEESRPPETFFEPSKAKLPEALGGRPIGETVADGTVLAINDMLRGVNKLTGTQLGILNEYSGDDPGTAIARALNAP